jgi:hypothetical protein
MSLINEATHVASAALDPDKAPALKLGGAAAVGGAKLLGIEVPELIGWATLIFFVLQIIWILWRMFDKMTGRDKGNHDS